MDTCYRHPGRETGVACGNCGRPICPDCMIEAPVGFRCPECAGKGRTQVRTARSLAPDEPTLTYVLMGLNIAVWLGAFLGGASATGGGFGDASLLSDGAVSRPGLADGEYWRLVTSGFLHAGALHLAFNMFALYILGGLLEPAIGRTRFALIYFVSLLGGAFGAVLVEPFSPTVGASGAIFGLMGAAVVVMRNRGINPMESGLGLWLGLNLLITFTIPNISIGGHIGGLVGGVLCALALFEVGDRVRGLPPRAPLALAGLVGVLAAAGAIAISA